MQEAGEKQAELLKTYKDSPVSAFIVASGMGQMDYVSLQTVFDELGEPARNSLFGQMFGSNEGRRNWCHRAEF